MREKNNMYLCNTGNADKPLFTGSYTRDTAVSVYEAFAEAAKSIHNAISVNRAKNKKMKD